MDLRGLQGEFKGKKTRNQMFKGDFRAKTARGAQSENWGRVWGLGWG